MRRWPSVLWLVFAIFFPQSQARSQGYAAKIAASKMTLAPGLEAKLFAAEPLVTQPVAIEFDDRGRLWVIQYLQYPNPAGLNRVKVDRFSRTAYDKFPEPPPKGPKGSDKVTILIDDNGDGQADRAQDFINGLNLTSGLAFGYGGVYIISPPYLLFYPDKNRDDIPDGDPEVLVKGFGIEDAHSVANSLTWGPDGWLYGLQGSTVTAKIDGIEFQQGVWRFHPTQKRFELFAEGGGNMWGLDFDKRGDLFASTNVGGFVMLHAVQGGYAWKQFGKHGPLHNPFTFGYFDHVPHLGLRGGHVSTGGLFYEADTFPKEWRGRFIAGDLLDHSIHWHEVSPRGTTFQARVGGDVLKANDNWFAPSDLTLGPDGALYVSDWHDRRTAHPDPDADWDRSNGRIYTLQPPNHVHPKTSDRRDQSTKQLIERLKDPNVWEVRRARRIIAERNNPDDWKALHAHLFDPQSPIPRLETLWALHSSETLFQASALSLLDDTNEDIRLWTIRFLGDSGQVSEVLSKKLVALASTEPAPRVRSQLAGTAARLVGKAGLEIAFRISARDLDGDDPFIPLRLWWAIERQAIQFRDEIVTRCIKPVFWQSKLDRETIAPRLIRRYAAENSGLGDETCLKLIVAAPASFQLSLMETFELATRDRRAIAPSITLAIFLNDRILSGKSETATIRLAARFGNDAALKRAVDECKDLKSSRRISFIELLGELANRSTLPTLISLATTDASPAIRLASLESLSRFDELAIAVALTSSYPQASQSWRAKARTLLLSRVAWAKVFVTEIEHGKIAASEVPVDEIRRAAAFADPGLNALIKKQWGSLTGTTPEAKLAEVRRLNNDVRAAPGNLEKGRLLFKEHCATCHKLFGEGKSVGPELTYANRQDRDFLLVSLVDPSGVVRKEFQTTVFQMRDGRVLTGLIAEQSPTQITLIGPNEERMVLKRDDIEATTDGSTSLMPEDLYRKFKPEDLRDLFRYLQSDPPRPAK
jgi:putative membrane-bound dehydrogenase-like protein